MKVSLQQLYTSYRKAKKEAFADTNCAHGLKFAEYERNLRGNLKRLAASLERQDFCWCADVASLGKATWVPKPSGISHYRQVINASVDYMVISALWVLQVGHLYDRKLDDAAVANRLVRQDSGAVNGLCASLYEPTLAACNRLRSKAIRAARIFLNDHDAVVMAKLDLGQYSNHIDASFLLHSEYLSRLGISLAAQQTTLTKELLQSFDTWNKAIGTKVGIPAGLSASRLIGNVLLRDLDRAMLCHADKFHYSRYFDDILLVLPLSVSVDSPDSLLQWIASLIPSIAQLHSGPRTDTSGPVAQLSLSLPYANRCKLTFARNKQKFVVLTQRQGAALLSELESTIAGPAYSTAATRQEMLQIIEKQVTKPDHDASQPSPSSLLKEVLMLNRLSFLRLVHMLEACAEDDRPSAWKGLRKTSYTILTRKLASPSGFFENAESYPRILGLMAACRDWNEAHAMLNDFDSLLPQLRAGVEPGTPSLHKLSEACENLANRMFEASLQSVTIGTHDVQSFHQRLFAVLTAHSHLPLTQSDIRRQAVNLRMLDWARRPYWKNWIWPRSDDDENIPAPEGIGEEEPFVMKAIQRFSSELVRAYKSLQAPYWPALAFPTRPIPLRDIRRLTPSLSDQNADLKLIVQGLTGFTLDENQSESTALDPENGASAYDSMGLWTGLPHPWRDMEPIRTPLVINEFFRIPPTLIEDPALGPGDSEFFVQFSQGDLDVFDDDGPVRQCWYFDGFVTRWLDMDIGVQGWASDVEFLEYFHRIPLALIQIEVTVAQIALNHVFRDIARDLDAGRDPDGWFRVKVRRLHTNEPVNVIVPVTVYPRLLGHGTRMALEEIMPVGQAGRQRLDDAVKAGPIPEADDAVITRLLGSNGVAEPPRAIVYDVGQGNCIGLCGPEGSVRVYFDFGGGVAQNLDTFPTKELTHFCFCHHPSILLSHWDHDHWSSCGRDRRALSQEWLAPRQHLTTHHLAMVAAIRNAGGKLWVLPQAFGPRRFGHIHLEVCTGSNRNNSGIALTLLQDPTGTGSRILMPGVSPVGSKGTTRGRNRSLLEISKSPTRGF